MAARALAILAALGAIAMSGCGSSDKENSTTISGGADPATVQVIKGWADELRAGNVAAASERFALPSVVQNGTAPLRLTTRPQVKAFNQSLPCGARLTEAVAVDRFTIATFKLTERPGPGECGNGVGETAKTAFVVRRGLITQWLRVVDTDQGTPTTQGPVV
ncbi:MAG TPA: hypothetical protein VGE91_06470 [Solirubrobacterales bacterium]